MIQNTLLITDGNEIVSFQCQQMSTVYNILYTDEKGIVHNVDSIDLNSSTVFTTTKGSLIIHYRDWHLPTTLSKPTNANIVYQYSGSKFDIFVFQILGNTIFTTETKVIKP